MCEGLSETFRHSVPCYLHFKKKIYTAMWVATCLFVFLVFQQVKLEVEKGEVRGACFLTHRSHGFIIFRLS